MMKKLILCRHAKSSWTESGLSDHARPLAQRGLRDAPRMARRVKESGYTPDLIITSDAIRAKQTATIFAENFGIPLAEIRETEALYHANVSEILKTVKSLPDSKQTVFLFGHNPGLNEFIQFFGFKIDNLPTTGIYGVEFSVPQWQAVGPDNCHYMLYDYPKNNG